MFRVRFAARGFRFILLGNRIKLEARTFQYRGTLINHPEARQRNANYGAETRGFTSEYQVSRIGRV